MCGSSRVHWEALCRVIDLYQELETNKPFNEALARRTNDTNAVPATDIMGLQAVSVLTEDDLLKSYDGLRVFRGLRKAILEQVPIDLTGALDSTIALQATDNRDRVYALLGLVHDGRAFVPIPDYKIDFKSLMAQMARNYLRATRNLEVIGAGSNRGDWLTLDGSIPSWTPDWLNPGPESYYVFEKDIQWKWNAAGGLAYEPSPRLSDSTLILAECLIFDKLDGLSSVYGRAHSSDDVGESITQPVFDFETSPCSEEKRYHCFNFQQQMQARNTTIQALYNCLFWGPRLDSQSDRNFFHFSSLSCPRILWLYHGAETRKWKAFLWAKREFDSPELRTWLHENRYLRIHGDTLEGLCKSSRTRVGPILSELIGITVPLLFSLALSVFCFAKYSSSQDQKLAGGGVALLFLTGLLCVPLLMLVMGSIRRQRCQQIFLRDMDKRMKERRLRLAITGGGSGVYYGAGGLICMVPGSARRGDVVAIIKGCTNPIILREHKDGYQVIGIAYLEDLMTGAATRDPMATWIECKLY